ncbi:MAG: hypothetical protein J6P05_00960 [Lachnospiraceae bacterium]|nr:hypothetical protein [Lachnospiraceae bacterium]
MRTVNVLFTGGVDSSFTMMYYSKFPVILQPYYLRDYRMSEPYELRAIHRILKDIRKNPGTKAEVRNLIAPPTYALGLDIEIWLAYQSIVKSTGLGKQYYYIACFAKQAGISDLNISLVHFEGGRGYRAVNNSGGLYQVEDSMGMEFYRLDPDKTEKNLYTIFENVCIPPSFTHTKQEEMEEMKRMGFADSIEKTWFCQRPINGEPCGMCEPCHDAIKMGFEWRFTPEGLSRYEEDLLTPKWKHKLRDLKLTLDAKVYNTKNRCALIMRHMVTTQNPFPAPRKI